MKNRTLLEVSFHEKKKQSEGDKVQQDLPLRTATTASLGSARLETPRALPPGLLVSGL